VQALAAGYHLAWAVGTGLGLASVVVAVLALREPRRRRQRPATPGVINRNWSARRSPYLKTCQQADSNPVGTATDRPYRDPPR
jgi:hypothetical protein